MEKTKQKRRVREKKVVRNQENEIKKGKRELISSRKGKKKGKKRGRKRMRRKKRNGKRIGGKQRMDGRG